MYAFVRCKRLPGKAAISRAASHALGSDRSSRSRRRKGYDGPRALALIKGETDKWERAAVVRPPGEGEAPGPLPYHVDYQAAYQRHMKRHNARKPGDTHPAMHLIVGVSPVWFERPDGTHEGHDITSEKVRRLVLAATRWAEAELGGVWAARYDLDEKGYGIVDLMCSPIRTHGKNGKNYVSIRKAQAELKQKYPGASKGFGAMQSSWADYATSALGETFDRGIPKRITGREHLIAEEYGAAMDAGRSRIAELEAEVARLAKKVKETAAHVLELARQRDRMKTRMQSTLNAVAGLRSRLTSWAVSRYRAASRPSLPPDPEHEELADEAIETAVVLAASVDTATPPERHGERLRERVRRERMQRGWGDDDPEAPLRTAWLAGAIHMDGTERFDYEDWRHALAHASARGVEPDRRDLIRLARRVEKSHGRYETRAERRRRRPTDDGEGLGR